MKKNKAKMPRQKKVAHSNKEPLSATGRSNEGRKAKAKACEKWAEFEEEKAVKVNDKPLTYIVKRHKKK